MGYQYEFVDQVPEDYFCKLCKHVAREYTITSCCGECFCKACIDAILQDKKPCPNCSKTDFTSFLHPKYHAKVQALEVHCTAKDRGCEWTGQLQHLDAHLDVTTGDCEYVDVECPKKCVQKVQKRNVDTHLANECPNREYRCPHCNFQNKFHVVSDHFDVCRYYPLACPNRCGASFERGDLPDHMRMCRLEEVQCVFNNAGCQAKFIRENEDEHMDQNTQKHLAMMPAATLRISQDFDQKLQEQQEVFERKLEQKDEEHKQGLQQLVGQLQEQQTRMERKLQKQQEVFEKKLEHKDNENKQEIQQLGGQLKEFREQVKQNDERIKQQQETFERKLQEQKQLFEQKLNERIRKVEQTLQKSMGINNSQFEIPHKKVQSGHNQRLYGPFTFEKRPHNPVSYVGSTCSQPASSGAVGGRVSETRMMLCGIAGCSFKGYAELENLCPDCYESQYPGRKAPEHLPLV